MDLTSAQGHCHVEQERAKETVLFCISVCWRIKTLIKKKRIATLCVFVPINNKYDKKMQETVLTPSCDTFQIPHPQVDVKQQITKTLFKKGKIF